MRGEKSSIEDRDKQGSHHKDNSFYSEVLEHQKNKQSGRQPNNKKSI